MPLPSIVNRAIDLLTTAYDAFFVNVIGLTPYVDRWVTTSGHPCIFCRTMEQISQQVEIPPGGRFPAPNFSILAYLAAQDLTYVENPPAHENCQCERVTIPRP